MWCKVAGLQSILAHVMLALVSEQLDNIDFYTVLAQRGNYSSQEWTLACILAPLQDSAKSFVDYLSNLWLKID
jgi:hypothetical protein